MDGARFGTLLNKGCYSGTLCTTVHTVCLQMSVKTQSRLRLRLRGGRISTTSTTRLCVSRIRPNPLGSTSTEFGGKVEREVRN